MGETFSTTGGVRVGSGIGGFNATWPFAKLKIDDDHVTVSCFTKRWTFPKANIRKLSHHKGMISRGLRIEHDVADVNPFFVFWTLGSFPTVRAELERHGYPVA